MNRLTLFGLFAVTAMLVCYAFENRSRWFILGVQRGVRAGLDLRLPAGRLAVWNCGGCLVAGRAAALVAGGEGGLILSGDVHPGDPSSVIGRRSSARTHSRLSAQLESRVFWI